MIVLLLDLMPSVLMQLMVSMFEIERFAQNTLYTRKDKLFIKQKAKYTAMIALRFYYYYFTTYYHKEIK